MKVRDIKTACNKELSDAFEYPVYDTDTYDGYERPAFFTELLPRRYHREGVNSLSAAFTYKITLLENEHSEALCLDVVDGVSEAFKSIIKCGNLHIRVEDIDYDWIDSNNDILQITMDFAEFTVINNLRSKPGSENYDLMEVLDMDIYVRPSMFEFTQVISAIKNGTIQFYITDAGRLIARQIGIYDKFINFDIVDESLRVSMIEALSQAVTFYIDGTGHLFARYKNPSGNEEMFNVYVTKGEKQNGST